VKKGDALSSRACRRACPELASVILSLSKSLP
jgi:hypothetical protein